MTDLLLVGSVPLDTVEEVMRRFGGPLGPHLATLPDGEVGPRSHWISRLHYQVLASHPQLEITRHPALENGIERLNPRNAADSWQFRVKEGVDKVAFGDAGWRLGYARDAINSYFVFKTLKEKGELAPHLRFQVSIPTINSALPSRIFSRPGDVEKVRLGFADALQAELKTILDHIPSRELAIQWDMANEIQEAYGSGGTFDGSAAAVARNLQQIRDLSPGIPEDVWLGYHFCFGTLGGWPRFQPADLSGAVALANAVIESAGRQIDWIHLPVLPEADEAFFKPLRELQPRGARVYLGVVHNMGGFAQRVAMARKYLPDFGFAAYCGFGRTPPSQMDAVLREHLKAADLPVPGRLLSHRAEMPA